MDEPIKWTGERETACIKNVTHLKRHELGTYLYNNNYRIPTYEFLNRNTFNLRVKCQRNKCSDRSIMEVKPPTLVNYDRPTNQQDRPGHGELLLPIPNLPLLKGIYFSF